MEIIIENEVLQAGIDSHGAELRSVIKKETNQEYMWEADPAYWTGTSPFLFPFIGKLEGFCYRYRGRTYEMTKHGFARDMDFRVALKERDRVVLALESTEETMEKYPFSFLLEVEYRLEGSMLSEQWRIHNRSEERMYFSIGGHPAFGCPLKKNGVRTAKRNDCFVKLYGADGKESLESLKIDMSAGLIGGGSYQVALRNGAFPITEHIFDSDALVFAGQGITAAALLDETGREYVRLEAPSCPVWGIWSVPSGEASYVCFEPWWGICDETGYQGTLEERPYMNQVAPGGVWEDGFSIVIESFKSSGLS